MTRREDPLLLQLAMLIRAEGNAEQILAAHTAGPDGRCKSCSAGGASSAKVLAPCTTYKAALVARREGPRK